MPRCPKCSTNHGDGDRYCPGCGRGIPSPTVSSATSSGTQDVTPDDLTHDDVTQVNPRPPSTGSGSRSSLSDSSEHGRFLPGAMLLGRYRIVSRLGVGGMGEVYRADDLELGSPVALKFMSAELAGDAGRLEFFRNEVRLSRQVAHPHVCRVHDIGDYEGLPFLSMEYVPGGDLKELLRRIGRLPPDKALELARQLCAGLAAAHDQGVLHRDLKPANVMLDERGRVRLTDFGLATMSQGATADEGVVGTLTYMAPEQLARGEATVQSDLYSLGLILFEMFTGTAYHRASSVKDLVAAHEQGAMTLPSDVVHDIDSRVERVILECLEREPGDRPVSAMAVAAALPGSDGLAAALAAGDTPSPQMVAASHGRGAYGTVKAAVLVGFVVANIVLIAYLNPRVRLFLAMGVGEPPEVLIHEAREIIDAFGHGDEPVADHASRRWLDKWSPAIREIREGEDRQPGDLFAVADVVPSPARFWYRQSPWALLPDRELGLVQPYSSPAKYRGDITVELSTRGDLVRFRSVPDAFHEDLMAPPRFEWAKAFERAGLDHALFRETAPVTSSPHGDGPHRFAWLGPAREGSREEVRVEGSELDGRLVRFDVDRAQDVDRALRHHHDTTITGYLGYYSRAAFYFVVMAVALGLAYRNVRLNRGDRPGAMRLACFVAVTEVVGWVLLAHHSAVGFVDQTVRGVGSALCTAAVAYALYLAFEPSIRRRMPELLVTWSRLLSGKWRDPLVARDVLVGLAWTPLYTAPVLVFYFLESWWTGGAGLLDEPYPNRMEAVSDVLYGYTRGLIEYGVIMALCLLGLYAGIQFVLRRTMFAAPVFLVLLTGVVAFYFSGVWLVGNMIASLLLAASTTVILVRHGLLATVTLGAAFHVMWLSPLTLDTDSWYFSTSLVNGGILLALTMVAYRRAVRGRP